MNEELINYWTEHLRVLNNSGYKESEYEEHGIERVITLTAADFSMLLSRECLYSAGQEAWNKAIREDIDAIMTVLSRKYEFDRALADFWPFEGKIAIRKKSE